MSVVDRVALYAPAETRIGRIVWDAAPLVMRHKLAAKRDTRRDAARLTLRLALTCFLRPPGGTP